MANLNDLQTILLSTAAQRDTGSLYPLPETLAGAGERLTKALTALLKRGLIDERETNDRPSEHRIDGDLRFGLFITEAGCAAIGVDDGDGGESVMHAAPATVATPPRNTKGQAVLALLQRDEGATLADLIAATGWLPHTTRAALTGIRKKGHAVEKSKRGDATCYRILAA